MEFQGHAGYRVRVIAQRGGSEWRYLTWLVKIVAVGKKEGREWGGMMLLRRGKGGMKSRGEGEKGWWRGKLWRRNQGVGWKWDHYCVIVALSSRVNKRRKRSACVHFTFLFLREIITKIVPDNNERLPIRQWCRLNYQLRSYEFSPSSESAEVALCIWQWGA